MWTTLSIFLGFYLPDASETLAQSGRFRLGALVAAQSVLMWCCAQVYIPTLCYGSIVCFVWALMSAIVRHARSSFLIRCQCTVHGVPEYQRYVISLGTIWDSCMIYMPCVSASRPSTDCSSSNALILGACSSLEEMYRINLINFHCKFTVYRYTYL